MFLPLRDIVTLPRFFYDDDNRLSAIHPTGANVTVVEAVYFHFIW